MTTFRIISIICLCVSAIAFTVSFVSHLRYKRIKRRHDELMVKHFLRTMVRLNAKQELEEIFNGGTQNETNRN